MLPPSPAAIAARDCWYIEVALSFVDRPLVRMLSVLTVWSML